MGNVVLEKKGKTAYVVLNRQEKYNAINMGIRQGLCDAWKEIEIDTEIRSVILTGGEKVFSTGQDLNEISEFRKKHPIENKPAVELPLWNLNTFGAQVKKPVIAAINGFCLGLGLLLTMVGSDIRVATETAQFGMPEVKYGMVPFLGFPAIMASYFPPAIAMEMLLTGKSISAEEAYRCGYVNLIVPHQDLISTAQQYADKINELSPLIAKNIKEVFRNVISPDPLSVLYSDMVAKVSRYSEDYIEGPRAYSEKRKPNWKGQ